MHIEFKQKSFEAIFTKDELLFLHQAFNEVCHGLRLENFGTRIGAADMVKNEMEKLASAYENFGGGTDANTIKIELSINQIKLYQKVIMVVCEEIEEWEFQTRTGEALSFANEMLVQLQKSQLNVPPA